MSTDIRLSDFVIDFLAQKGVEHVFTVVGGGSIWLCDSLKKTSKPAPNIIFLFIKKCQNPRLF